jgi:hypothetical protein
MIYDRIVDEDVKRALSNLEENISFKAIKNFVGKCLRSEETGCRHWTDDIGINRCIGRQQGLYALLEAFEINKKEQVSAQTLTAKTGLKR